MSKPVMKVFRVMCDKRYLYQNKPVAHYVNEEDAVKVAQSLLLRAGKHVSYHVDCVEVY